MKQLNIFDKDLKKISYKNCSISILLGSDGYCFSIKDDNQDRFMAMHSIPGDYCARDVKASFDDLVFEIWGEDIPMRISNLVYAKKHTIVVPAAFSDEAQISEILNFHFPFDQESQVVKNDMDAFSVSFLVNNNDYLDYQDMFKPKIISNIAVPLIKTALQYAENQKGDAVYAQIWRDYFDLVVIKDKKLALYNTYKFKSGNDIVYFVLNAYKQLILDPKTCSLMLSGWIEKHDNSIIQLNKFIRNMYFETLNPNKKYSYHFQDTLPHYFIHFLNID